MNDKRITVEYLRELCACKDDIELFAETFPNGANLTRYALNKALEAGLDLVWFAYRTLPRKRGNRMLADIVERWLTVANITDGRCHDVVTALRDGKKHNWEELRHDTHVAGYAIAFYAAEANTAAWGDHAANVAADAADAADVAKYAADGDHADRQWQLRLAIRYILGERV
jgi:hypothetical protein